MSYQGLVNSKNIKKTEIRVNHTLFIRNIYKTFGKP